MKVPGRTRIHKARLLAVSFTCVVLIAFSILLGLFSCRSKAVCTSTVFRGSRSLCVERADGNNNGAMADERRRGKYADNAAATQREALYSETNWTALTKDEGPPLRLEQARRHVARTSRELGDFIRYQLNRLLHTSQADPIRITEQNNNTVDYIMRNIAGYQRVIEDQLEVISNSDGWEMWRKKEAHLLQEIVQKRLYALQNPGNCTGSPILLCSLTNKSGFASAAHEVLWCFVKAYFTQRRMVLASAEWHYAPDGWETFFKPLSDSCGYGEGPDARNVIFGPGRNGGENRYLMTVLPEDLGPRIVRIHGNPLAWWYGQFISYLFRPNSQLKSLLEETKRKSGFERPIVGIHVRRSDKIGREARSHEFAEYMRHAEDYFRGREIIFPDVVRKVYVATDAPEVVTECQKKFTNYDCFYNPGSAELASSFETRYSNESSWGVLVDVFMLANTDFIVCTFSSGLCRLAYELMQAVHDGDASNKVISLDVQHHYAWARPPPWRALYNHKANSAQELNFTKGDMFSRCNMYSIMYEALKGKVADGFDKLCYSESKEMIGLIPTYKITEILTMLPTRRQILGKL